MSIENQIEKRIGGWWWPKADTEAWVAINGEVGDIDTIMHFAKFPGTVIQAGGNCGMWPKRYAEIFRNVISAEPDPVNFECLRRNTEGVHNIQIMNLAFGDKPGMTDIEVRWDVNRGANRLAVGDKTPVITIDSLKADACDLLQLDVEGYEHLALLGAEKTIKAFKPTIVLELKGHGEHYGYTDEETINYVNSLGYKLAHVLRTDHIFVPLP